MILKPASNRNDDIAELERIAKLYPHVAHKAGQQIGSIIKGAQGEGNAAHFLDREFRDSDRIAILHDIRLECADGDFAQIDHLLISRVEGSAMVLETKNYSGNLRCDEHGDWTIYYGSKPTPIASPIEQARRQAKAIKRWFKTHEIDGIHKVVPVVLVNPRSYISRKNLREGEYVVKSDNFARWFDNQLDGIGLGGALFMLGRYMSSGMDEMGLRALGARICRESQPAKFDWELRLGVKNHEQRLTETNSQAHVHNPPPASTNQPAPVTAAPSNGILVPERIATPYGDITIKCIGDAYAVRNPYNEDVISVVQTACKGKGRWNPRYRNWLIPENNISEVASQIQSNIRKL